MLRRVTLVSGVGVLFSLSLAGAQPPGGFPGAPEPPRPGQVLPPFVQERLNLTAEQKKQLEQVQKEVDAKLEKILTTEQKKQLAEVARNPFGGPGGGFGPPGAFGGPGGGFGGPGGGFGPPGGPGGGFGPPGGPGGFGMGFAGPRLEDVKKRLGATEEEWKVIGPKLQKVLTARQVLTADARAVAISAPGAPSPETPGGNGPGASGPGAGPGPGGRPGPGFGGDAGTNRISQAQAEFRAVLDDPKHTKAELQEKAAAVRKAREKVRAELLAAQKDLVQMLTSEQEAVLVGLGYLE
jgi:hypothetical protein